MLFSKYGYGVRYNFQLNSFLVIWSSYDAIVKLKSLVLSEASQTAVYIPVNPTDKFLEHPKHRPKI